MDRRDALRLIAAAAGDKEGEYTPGSEQLFERLYEEPEAPAGSSGRVLEVQAFVARTGGG